MLLTDLYDELHEANKVAVKKILHASLIVGRLFTIFL